MKTAKLILECAMGLAVFPAMLGASRQERREFWAAWGRSFRLWVGR